MMEPFDVWMRKRVALKPHVYGPEMVAKSHEVDWEETLKEPVVVRREAPRASVTNIPVDFKSKAAGDDSQDAEVVEDEGMEELTLEP